MILEIADGSDTGLEEILLGDFADAVEGSDGQWFEELDFFGLANDGEAVWLFEVTGEFSEQFIGGYADGGGETLLFEDGLLDQLSERDSLQLAGIGVVGLVMGADVDVGFIDGDLLDLIPRELSDDGHDGAGSLFIGFHAWADEDGGGAEAGGSDAGHGGADAELAGFVACGGDDSALSGRGSNGDGSAAQVGVVTLFYGGVEGIHIEMEDDAEHDVRAGGLG